MSIVPGSTKMNAAKKGGRADLEKLLQFTPQHPKGRVQLDPTTGLIRNPKNNVMYKKKLPVKVEGQVVGVKEIDINGGHIKPEGSVWRRPLNGPSRYHAMVKADDHRFTYAGRSDRTAPQLSAEEMEEYQLFRVFVQEMGEKLIVPEDRNSPEHANINEEFYTWLASQDRSKIKLLPLTITSTHAVAPVK